MISITRTIILLSLAVAALLGQLSYAQTPEQEAEKILNFKQWKDHEVIEADNRVARLSNQITLARQDKGYSFSYINKLGSDLRVALGAASVVREYSIEQYFNVYLSQYALNPGMIRDIARSLSGDEIAELLQLYFKSKSPTPSAVSESEPQSGRARPSVQIARF